jgi:hypothetical protein
VALEGTPETWRRIGRVQDSLDDLTLVFDGQAEDFGFLNGTTGRIAGSTDHKIRQAAPLDFGGAFEQCVNIGGQTRFQTGCGGNLLHKSRIRHAAVQVKLQRAECDNPDARAVIEPFRI